MEITEELSKYSKKEINFILSLMQTDNISKSAKIAGISEMTAHKWLKNGLKDEINKLRKIYIENNFKKLEFASIKATDKLLEMLDNENCSNSVKLSISKTIIEYALKIREQTSIIERLEGIEKIINEREN